jgi:hypothetical protein
MIMSGQRLAIRKSMSGPMIGKVGTFENELDRIKEEFLRLA